MKKFDEFIRGHDVDIARLTAGLLFFLSLMHAYSAVFGIVTFGLDSRFFPKGSGLIWLFVGLSAAVGVAAWAEFLLARALWNHRPLARRIAVWCIWILLISMAFGAVYGPFADKYTITLPGFHVQNPATWLRIIFPVTLIPPTFALWLAFECPATRERFTDA